MFLEIVVPPLEKPLTYSLGDFDPTLVGIGSSVVITLGKREEHGFIVGVDTPLPEGLKEDKIKPIKQIISSGISFLPEQLSFFEWMSDYYGETLSSVLDHAVPPRAKADVQKIINLVGDPLKVKLGKAQQDIITVLSENNNKIFYDDLRKSIPKFSSATLKTLVKKSLVTIDESENSSRHIFKTPKVEWAIKSVILNEQQNAATEKIVAATSEKKFATFLLHGVTGSGKTEVYIESILKLPKEKNGAIIIVPEIALTPQLVDRFRVRLGDDIAVLHSGLPKKARWDAWRALSDGRLSIAIGARSALFAPVKNLGIVIVDEEHDSSFKQSEGGFRYNARDCAIARAKFASCPVVLGSATPSLESLYNATQSKRYEYLPLSKRSHTASAVEIEIIDLTKIKPWEMKTPHISGKLFKAIEDSVAANEQIFILYNRRGFSNYLQCDTCQQVLECPHCSVTLTYHNRGQVVCCHYCNLTQPFVEECPKCRSSQGPEGASSNIGRLQLRGGGTERVFDELKGLFPSVPIARFDRDTVQNEKDYREALDAVREGRIKILVGTKMIAKGHDLPNVTLVGVVDCDVGLHMPDFRASERVYQLLSQVSGRAGRGSKAGRVILQTRAASHYALTSTKQDNFFEFATRELECRKNLSYPPYARLLRVVAQHENKDLPAKILQEMADLGKKMNRKDVVFLGPAPCPLSKLRNEYRYHLLLKSRSAQTLNYCMKTLQKASSKIRSVKIWFDMDPQEML